MKHLNYLKKLLLPMLVAMAVYFPAMASTLSGTYTIGGTTPNFTDLNAAINSANGLALNGVSGPVVFNIRAGTYNTSVWYQQVIPAILGASSTNTITFQAESGAGTVTISGVGSSAANYIVKFNSGSYVTFKNLNITNTNTTYGRLFEFAGTASYDGITGCTLTGPSTTSSTNSLATIYANGLTGGNNNITFNSFINNSYDVYWYGSSTASVTDNNLFDNNTMAGAYAYGIYSYYTTNLKITNNTITKTGAGTFYGINTYYNLAGLQINGNSITATSYSGTMYGIYPYYIYNGSQINNNTITANSGISGSINAMYCYYMYCNATYAGALTSNYGTIKGNTINVNTTNTGTGSGSITGIYHYLSNYDSICNNNITLTTYSGSQTPLYNYGTTPVYTASAPASSYGGYNTITGNTWNCQALSSASYSFYFSYYSEKLNFSNNNIRMTTAGGSFTQYGYYADSLTFNNNTIYDSTTTGSMTIYDGMYGNPSTSLSNYGSFNNNNLRYVSTGSSAYINHYMGYYNQNASFNNNNIYISAGYYLNNYLGYNDVNGTWNNNNVTVIALNGYVYNYMAYYTANATGNNNNITGAAANGYYLYNYFGYAQAGSGNAPSVFDHNTINLTYNGNAYGYGSYLYGYTYSATTFSNNIININAGNPSNYIYGCYFYSPALAKFYNNAINMNVSGSSGSNLTPLWIYYAYPAGANNEFYNNTFAITAPSATSTYAVYNYSTPSTYGGILNFRNNIIYNSSAGGAAMWVYDNTGGYIKGDYNNIYSTNGNIASVNGSPITSLQAYRTATGQEKNSLSYNPGLMSTTDVHPNPANSASWSIQGRGVQIPGNSLDLAGNPRATTTSLGVPDLGAYEFTPTATAPLATAIPAAAVAGSPQVFTFGQDTVAVINWASTSTVPAAGGIAVKQYSGVTIPAAFSSFNPTSMYFYDSVGISGGSGYNYSIKNYYKDPWLGTIATEAVLHLAKNDVANAGSWIGYPFAVSSANTTLNYINTIPTPSGFSNFGLYTGMDIANNAGVSSVASPVGTFCPGTYTVKVNVANNGSNTINGVQIFWQIVPGPVNQINWTTPIGINTGTPGSNIAVVTLGNITFGASTVNLKVWTSLPNAVVDPVASDDTLAIALHSAFSGTYTIGGTTPDFPDFVTAVNALKNYGVCGPTTFNIRAGTYAGNVVLNAVSGMSAVNRVTFQSENGIASGVTISYAATTSSADNYVIALTNGNYYSIKNITIAATGASYGYAVTMSGSSSFDSLAGCIINVPTVASSYMACIYASGIVANDGVVFLNNVMNGGYYGIYWYPGSSSTAAAKNVTIIGNTLSQVYEYALYVYYTGNFKIDYNTINATSTLYYGLYLYAYYTYGGISYPFELIGNKILNMSVSGCYPLMLQYPNGYSGVSTAPATRSKIINNVVSCPSGYYGAIYLYYPMNVDMWNNTFNIGSVGYCGAYIYSYTSPWIGLDMRNNVFQLGSGGSYAAYLYITSGNNVIDYNNWYYTGTSPFQTYYSSYTGFAAYKAGQKAYNFETNSLTYNPGLTSISNAAPDPTNPNSWSLNGRGVHIANNLTDINGNPRVSLLKDGAPDLGAYEFDPTVAPPNCTAIPATATPGAKQYFLFGADTVATVNWRADLLLTSALNVKQYSGRQAPGITTLSPNRNMWFYTDIKPVSSGSTYHFDADVYYKSIWMGTIQNEPGLMVAEKATLYPWIIYANGSSGTTISRKMLSVSDLTSFGTFTGIDTVALFSAIAHPGGSTIFCTGGSVTLFSNTGNSYQYQWNKDGNPISGANSSSYVATAGGDYTVTVTAPGPPVYTATSLPISVTVVPPPMALVAANGTLTYCTGTSLALSASTGAISYQWQLNGSDIPGATNTTYTVASAGSYTVKATNIGCTVTSTATVVSPGPLVVDLGPDIRGCEIRNQAYIVDAGHPGAKYAWSTGDTTQTISIFKGSGVYKVTVNAGPGCIATDSVNVQIDPLPSVVGISYVKAGSTYSFTASGVQNATTYLWIFNDQGNITYSNSQTPPAQTFSGSMITKLVVCNSCGCDTTLLTDWATNVGNTSKEGYELNVYPNPAKDKITLSVKGEVTITDVTVLNALGEVVYKEEAGNVKSREINVSGFANGHYMIRANTSEGTVTKPFNVIR